MPVYDYKCTDHGPFSDLATFEDAGKPMPCPTCQQLSARIIVLPPEVIKNKTKHNAAEANEKSQHEPLISTAEQRKKDVQHQKQCGCQNHVNKNAGQSRLMYTASGEKMFPSMRPWMISH